MSEEAYPKSPRLRLLSKETLPDLPRAMSPIWESAAIEQIYITQDSQRTYHAELFQNDEYHRHEGDLLQRGIERKALDL